MSDSEPVSGEPFLSNKNYDRAKFVAQIVLPALGTLYFALSGLWGLPYGQQVVGSITAIDVFLGLLLGFSSQTYNNSDAKYDGSIDLVPDHENGITDANVSLNPDALETKNEIIVKIKKV